MGDTQTNSYTASAAPTFTDSKSSLRGSSQRNRGLQFSANGRTQGILDAFADVFSQMTSAKTPITKPNERSEDCVASCSSETDQEEPAADETDESPQAEAKVETDTDVAFLAAAPEAEQVQTESVAEVETVRSDEPVPSKAVETKPDRPNKEHPKDPLFEQATDKSEIVKSETAQQEITEPVVATEQQVAVKSAKPKQPSDVKPILQGETVVEKTASSDKAAMENPNAGTAPTLGESTDESDKDGMDRRENRRNRHGAKGVNRQSSNGRPTEAVQTQRRAAEQVADQASSTVQASATSQVANEPPLQTSLQPQVSADPTATQAATAAATRAVAAVASATGTTSAVTGRTEGSTAPSIPSGSESTRPNDPTKKQAGRAEKSSTSDLISRAKLIQRVSKAFQHLGPDGGHVRLRLAPAELGTVRLEMHIQQRKIQTRVIAETEAAASALRENLPELRQRLEAQGMQIEKMSVEVESESQGENRSLGDNASNDQDGGSGQFGSPWRRSPSTSRRSDENLVTNNHPSLQALQTQIPSTGGVDVRL